MIASAGSRYTYSANTLAYMDLAKEDERIALVGMSCQSSIPPVMKQRKAGKVAAQAHALDRSAVLEDLRRRDLRGAVRGEVRPAAQKDIKKMNIKGVFQIWMHNGDYHEVPLKECHQWTREGCKMCPDFAAEHADISTGGIGKYNDWTLTIVRTDAGRELMERMLADGVIQVRPGDDDPDAIALMHKLSRKSRKRWPEFAVAEPGLVPPLPPKPAPPPRPCASARWSSISWIGRRSAAALSDVEFVRDVDACAGADVVIVDLARFGADVAALRAAAPARPAGRASARTSTRPARPPRPRPAPTSCSRVPGSSAIPLAAISPSAAP